MGLKDSWLQTAEKGEGEERGGGMGRGADRVAALGTDWCGRINAHTPECAARWWPVVSAARVGVSWRRHRLLRNVLITGRWLFNC